MNNNRVAHSLYIPIFELYLTFCVVDRVVAFCPGDPLFIYEMSFMLHRGYRMKFYSQYYHVSFDSLHNDRMVNQTKTQDICCKCTLRETSAKLLSKRESQSSRLVPTRLTSA